jgi:hypothetical protein
MEINGRTKNNEKTRPIEIRNTFDSEKQYNLKQNFFDPTKNSPPNIFMIKLYNRINQYENNYRNSPIFESK